MRLLKAEEIRCMVKQVSYGKALLLLYKSARVDMQLLDELYGQFGWKREHRVINDNLFCRVSIKSPDGEWIYKEDVGTESNMDREKGESSDAFKRACTNWGIGRELYSVPLIRILVKDSETYKTNSGKDGVRTRFYVSKIEYQDNEISLIQIKDEFGDERFNWTLGKKIVEEKTDVEAIRDQAKKMLNESVAPKEWIAKCYSQIEGYDEKLLIKLMKAIGDKNKESKK